jgi:hypothetical protein
VLIMRIGTWNLDAKAPSAPQSARLDDQLEFMASENCDVWLLTEVPFAFAMAPGTATFSRSMGPSKAFAAVWARDGLEALTTIHPAAAFARIGDMRVCSCVLPWRAASAQSWPDSGELATMTQTAVDHLREGLSRGAGDLVWGGDWNQSLQGRDHVGTPAGRLAVRALIATLGLTAPTSGLAHAADGGQFSIDHIAVPSGWTIGDGTRRIAESAGERLSDHDAYIVEAKA